MNGLKRGVAANTTELTNSGPSTKRRRTSPNINATSFQSPTTFNPIIHSIIVRDFGPPHGKFVGWIQRYFEKEKLWQVMYEDGDTEDLNRTELEKYLLPEDNQYFGEFYKVTFPANEALGVVIAPNSDKTARNNNNNKETNNANTTEANDNVKPKSVVVKTKPFCIGRGVLTKFDEVALVNMDSSSRNLTFTDIVNLLRGRDEEKPLNVIFKRHKENISLRKSTFEKCKSIFYHVCSLLSNSSQDMVKEAQIILNKENLKMKNNNGVNNDGSRKIYTEHDEEFCDYFFKLLKLNDLKALFFHHAPLDNSDKGDIEKTMIRFTRLKSTMEKLMSRKEHATSMPEGRDVVVDDNSNGDSSSINQEEPIVVAAAAITTAPTPGSVNYNSANSNTGRNIIEKTTDAIPTSVVANGRKNASVAVAAAAAARGRTNPTMTMDNTVDLTTAAPALQTVSTVRDAKKQFLLIRKQNIQTPSSPIYETSIEPAHTQYLCVGNIPIYVPQVGLYAWAFMGDATHNSRIGLPVNSTVQIGYYRALIIGIQNDGAMIRLHWLCLGLSCNDPTWYDTKKLRLWGPAPSPAALFTFLETQGRHMITLTEQEQQQMLAKFNQLREAIHGRYGSARKVALHAFKDSPTIPIDDSFYDYCILFPFQILGIGIDMEHSDGGVKVTSVRGVENNTELNTAMQNIHQGDRIVGVRRQNQGKNFDFTTINSNLKDLIQFIHTAGRPLQIFFLRRSHHPYVRFKQNIEKQRMFLQAKEMQKIQQIQQQTSSSFVGTQMSPAQQLLLLTQERQRRQQEQLAQLHKQQQDILRQRQLKQFQAVQLRAQSLASGNMKSNSTSNYDQGNKELIIKATNGQLKEAYKRIESLHATGKKLHDKLKAAYKVIETTKKHLAELQHAIAYLTATDGKLILSGISKRVPNIAEIMGKMDSNELEEFHETFVVPYDAEVLERKKGLANENAVKNMDENNDTEKKMDGNKSAVKNMDENNGAVSINVDDINSSAIATNDSS